MQWIRVDPDPDPKRCCQAIILVGMEEEEIDLFIKRLEKVFQKARQTELSQQSAQGSKFRSRPF